MSDSLEYPIQPDRTPGGIERRLRLRLVHPVYVVTLVAASIWLCGPNVGLVGGCSTCQDQLGRRLTSSYLSTKSSDFGSFI